MSAVSVLSSLSSFWNLRRYWPESMEEASTRVREMVASQYDVFFISMTIFSLASQMSLSFVLRRRGRDQCLVYRGLVDRLRTFSTWTHYSS